MFCNIYFLLLFLPVNEYFLNDYSSISFHVKGEVQNDYDFKCFRKNSVLKHRKHQDI